MEAPKNVKVFFTAVSLIGNMQYPYYHYLLRCVFYRVMTNQLTNQLAFFIVWECFLYKAKTRHDAYRETSIWKVCYWQQKNAQKHRIFRLSERFRIAIKELSNTIQNGIIKSHPFYSSKSPSNPIKSTQFVLFVLLAFLRN